MALMGSEVKQKSEQASWKSRIFNSCQRTSLAESQAFLCLFQRPHLRLLTIIFVLVIAARAYQLPSDFICLRFADVTSPSACKLERYQPSITVQCIFAFHCRVDRISLPIRDESPCRCGKKGVVKHYLPSAAFVYLTAHHKRPICCQQPIRLVIITFAFCQGSDDPILVVPPGVASVPIA